MFTTNHCAWFLFPLSQAAKITKTTYSMFPWGTTEIKKNVRNLNSSETNLKKWFTCVYRLKNRNVYEWKDTCKISNFFLATKRQRVSAELPPAWSFCINSQLCRLWTMLWVTCYPLLIWRWSRDQWQGLARPHTLFGIMARTTRTIAVNCMYCINIFISEINAVHMHCSDTSRNREWLVYCRYRK